MTLLFVQNKPNIKRLVASKAVQIRKEKFLKSFLLKCYIIQTLPHQRPKKIPTKETAFRIMKPFPLKYFFECF